MARSNSANAPVICSISFPLGVVACRSPVDRGADQRRHRAQDDPCALAPLMPASLNVPDRQNCLGLIAPRRNSEQAGTSADLNPISRTPRNKNPPVSALLRRIGMLADQHNSLPQRELLIGPMLHRLIEGSTRYENRSRGGDDLADVYEHSSRLRTMRRRKCRGNCGLKSLFNFGGQPESETSNAQNLHDRGCGSDGRCSASSCLGAKCLGASGAWFDTSEGQI